MLARRVVEIKFSKKVQQRSFKTLAEHVVENFNTHQ